MAPNAVIEEIRNQGSRSVVSRLWQEDYCWETLLDHVSSGDSAWLTVAERLKPATDAGASLGLSYAVARALPNAPAEVLGMVGRGFRLEYICTLPFIEPPAEVVVAYRARAKEALQRLGPAIPYQAECLDRIMESVH